MRWFRKWRISRGHSENLTSPISPAAFANEEQRYRPHPETAMSGGAIWVSDAYRRHELSIGFVDAPMRNKITSIKFRDEDVEIAKKHSDGYKKNSRGEHVDPDEIPNELYWNLSEAPPSTIPPLFSAGHPMLRADVAEIFQHHDLGQARLQETQLFDHDVEASLDDVAYALIFQNQGHAIDIAKSDVEPVWPGREVFKPKPDASLADCLVPDTRAVNGPAVWIDPCMFRFFFLSDALGSELSATGFGPAFGLTRLEF